jgi:hypothetical protein
MQTRSLSLILTDVPSSKSGHANLRAQEKNHGEHGELIMDN